ncbi:MAG: hypothetical protein HY077_17970 [Elusimicrobia bacterium]|nr:hypothetical protein [Elusimicrobiota bacterium]
MNAWLWLLCAGAFGLEIERFPSYSRIVAIEVHRDSALVSTTGGAYRLSFSPGLRAEAVSDEPSAAPPAAALPPVEGFPVTARVDGYAGTFGGGLRRLPSGERVAGTPDVVTALAASPVGLLCGGEHGLFLVSHRGVSLVGLRSLPEENVNALAVGGGALWIGHFDGGLSSLSSGVWRHWGLAEGLPSEWVDDVSWDGERLWGATEKGVFWISDGRAVAPDEPRLREPSSALFFSRGSTYIAQSGRVLVWTRGRLSSLAVPEKHPQKLWVEGRTVWLAGLEGLYRLRDDKVLRYDALGGPLPADWITALAVRNGTLLVGTYDAGLFSLSGGKSKTLRRKVWVNVGALAVDGEAIALGAREDGLHLLRDGSWTRVARRDGLPGDDVSAVAFDGTRTLWVGTRSGLARVRL